MRNECAIHPFDPAADIAVRWPDWSVYESTEMPTGATEKFFPESKVAFVEASGHAADWALAHVTAHLDLGHHHVAVSDGFTREQESDALRLASLRMDAWPPSSTPQQPSAGGFPRLNPRAG